MFRMFGFLPSLVELITASINPKRVLPTMLAFGVVEELLERYEERRNQDLLLSTPIVRSEPDPYLFDVSTVNAVKKLKAQGVEIPPLMQRNYDRILKGWEEGTLYECKV